MIIFKSALVLLVMIAFLLGFQTGACAEERFGPWAYFAPYYFPPDNSCLGNFCSPADYMPRYESPNPPKPCYGGDCAFPSMPVPPPRRMARKGPPTGPVGSPGAVLPPPVRGNQAQLGSSLKPVNQPVGPNLGGPRPVNHPGPQQRIVPVPAGPNQGR